MFTHFAFVGSRTTRERNARGRGISTFGVTVSGSWTPIGVTATAANPSYLAVDAEARTLYSVHGDGTELSSYRIAPDGVLIPLELVTSAGLNPVDVVLDPTGEFVIVTNHLSDGLAVRRREPDGRMTGIVGYAAATGALGPHRSEQTRVKPHQARFLPGGRFIAVPNKGADTVTVFELDRRTGALTERTDCTARLREGSGPRNVVMHPSLPILYVVCELDSTVCAIAVEADGRLSPIEVVPCRPPAGVGLSRAAAIVIEPDAGHLHVTNRGDDCMASFALESSGELHPPRFRQTLGRTPRFACMDPNTGALFVANEDSDTIVRFGRDGADAVVVAETPSPVSIVFSTAKASVSSTVVPLAQD